MTESANYPLPERDGLEILQSIAEQETDTAVIFIAGYGNEAAAVQAMQDGAYDYIRKRDINPETLQKTITNAIPRPHSF